MIDVDERMIVTGLEIARGGAERGEHADWQDVLRRAGVQRGSPPARGARRAGGVAAVLCSRSRRPSARRSRKGIGDFSAWLTGHPGTQRVPASERRAFDAGNGQSSGDISERDEGLRELITHGGRREAVYHLWLS